jgi:hypothetical protein
MNAEMGVIGRVLTRQKRHFQKHAEFPELAHQRHWAIGFESLLLACVFNRSVQHRLQSIGWRLEAQGLSGTLIEP